MGEVETAEATNFGAVAIGEGYGHAFKDGVHGNLDILGDKLWVAAGKTGDEIGFGHG